MRLGDGAAGGAQVKEYAAILEDVGRGIGGEVVLNGAGQAGGIRRERVGLRSGSRSRSLGHYQPIRSRSRVM